MAQVYSSCLYRAPRRSYSTCDVSGGDASGRWCQWLLCWWWWCQWRWGGMVKLFTDSVFPAFHGQKYILIEWPGRTSRAENRPFRDISSWEEIGKYSAVTLIFITVRNALPCTCTANLRPFILFPKQSFWSAQSPTSVNSLYRKKLWQVLRPLPLSLPLSCPTPCLHQALSLMRSSALLTLGDTVCSNALPAFWAMLERTRSSSAGRISRLAEEDLSSLPAFNLRYRSGYCNNGTWEQECFYISYLTLTKVLLKGDSQFMVIPSRGKNLLVWIISAYHLQNWTLQFSVFLRNCPSTIVILVSHMW